MVALDIRLGATEHVREFVNLVNRFPFDVDLRQGRFVVDAKSILGIFSLDRTKPITVEIFSDHSLELQEALTKFVA